MNEPRAAEAEDAEGVDDFEGDAPDADEVDGSGGGGGSGAGPSQPLPSRRSYDLDAPRPDERPTRRADCLPGGPNAARPCPFVTCASHAVHGVVTPAEYGRLDPEEVLARAFDPARPSCVLDIVDEHPGGVTLDGAGDLFDVTRERARQMEQKAFSRVLPRLRRRGITEADVREILGAFEDVSSGGPQSGRGKTRVRVADNFRRDRPAVAAHLPGPGEVEPGGTFWCDTIHAALPTVLCNLRHTAVSAYPQNVPVHRACAACPDGAALLARVGNLAKVSRADPLPTEAADPADRSSAEAPRRHLPLLRAQPPARSVAPVVRPAAVALELARFDPIARAAAEAAQETTMQARTDEPTPTSTRSTEPTPAALPKSPNEIELPDVSSLRGDPPAEEMVMGRLFRQVGTCAWCNEQRAAFRPGVAPILKVLCAHDRQKVQTRINRHHCSPEDAYRAERYYRLTGLQPPSPKPAAAPAPAASAAPRSKAPPAAKPKAPSGRPARASGPTLEADPFGYLARMSEAVRRFGGVEALEAVNERVPDGAGTKLLAVLDSLRGAGRA